MFQYRRISSRNWRAGVSVRSWLSILVDTFEKTSQTNLRAVPCEDRVLAAFKAQLARPAPPRSLREPDSRRLH
jgi:hypothetical protein